jgi:aminopeptidase YwaD
MDRRVGESLKRAARDVLDLTGRLVDKLGPRIFGSESCARAADEIATELGRHCDSVRKERFSARPGAFWHSFRVGAVAYIAGTILLIIGGNWIYLSIFFFLIILLEIVNFIFYSHLFDPFFPRVEGTNVIGVVEPAGPATQQIFVVGHHDSTYIYTYLARLRKLYVFRIGSAYLFSLFGFCISLLLGLYRLIDKSDPAYRGVLLIILLAGLFFMVPVFFYMGRKGSPGAGDNLVACAMGIKIAERFGGVHAPKRLRRTRVIILSTDGEEPGLLGAEAFARKHREELLAVKTYVLNFDSIYKARELTLLTKDRNGTIRLSGSMAEKCGATAAELGYPVKMIPIPTFAGATDAARFSEIGVEALSIVGMSIPPIRENPGFHTPDDTVEQIEPEAVEACLEIAYHYILDKDRLG